MNMRMKPFDHDELLKLDGDVPFVRSVPYGTEHALAMFVANQRIFSALPRGAASSDAAPASAPASAKTWSFSKSRTSAPKSNGSVKRGLTFGYSVKEPCECWFACQNRRAT